MATKKPTMMAGADEPATLSGLRQPMATAMVKRAAPSRQDRDRGRVSRGKGAATTCTRGAWRCLLNRPSKGRPSRGSKAAMAAMGGGEVVRAFGGEGGCVKAVGLACCVGVGNKSGEYR